jgi:hypothetical protein
MALLRALPASWKSKVQGYRPQLVWQNACVSLPGSVAGVFVPRVLRLLCGNATRTLVDVDKSPLREPRTAGYPDLTLFYLQDRV